MKENCPVIEGVILKDLQEFSDRRGVFFEVFRKEWLKDVFGDGIQMNCSRSRPGVIRGLHYHRRQYDFWVPLKGRLRVGLADLRKGSGTGGESMLVEMDADKPRGLLIPPGVAHGFAALKEVILVYVVSNYYDGSDEHGIAWNDPALGIDWGIEDPILSERDSQNSVSASDIDLRGRENTGAEGGTRTPTRKNPH